MFLKKLKKKNIYGDTIKTKKNFNFNPVEFPSGPWDNHQTVISVGRTQHRFFFMDPSTMLSEGHQMDHLSTFAKFECQLMVFKQNIAQLEKVNKDYEDKLYGKRSQKLSELHVTYLIVKEVKISGLFRKILKKMKF